MLKWLLLLLSFRNVALHYLNSLFVLRYNIVQKARSCSEVLTDVTNPFLLYSRRRFDPYVVTLSQ